MSRERVLIAYCAAVGVAGWGWLLLLSGPGAVPLGVMLLFLVLALVIEGAGFRVPPSDPHSLVAVVLLTALLVLDPADAALVAALSGLIFGALIPLIYGRPHTFYMFVARPFLRSGVRALAILTSAALASVFGGSTLALFLCSVICYPFLLQISRAIREHLQGGHTGVVTWWRSSWRAALSSELLPLPAAWLCAAIYTRLGLGYFAITAALLIMISVVVRRTAFNLRRQSRSVRELALLNQVSRAIIRAEMDVYALCDLIYREASKVVDTATFHLGLFAPTGDNYTLVVRVQDRVRLPVMEVDLPAGDGIIGWMRETGRALLVEDFIEEMEHLPARPRYQSERPPRSGIYVPLMDGDTVIGSISIQSYRPRVFDADDMRLLSLIADQAAVAISKARAFENARQRALQLKAIYEVSERITAILDLDQLLPSIVSLIRERFGYHPVHIFTLENDGRLEFRASTANDAAATDMRHMMLRQGSGIIGAATSTGQPVLVNDVLQDPRYISDDAQTRAELAVPLRFADQSIGVLDVQSTKAGRFSDSDMFVMQTLAGQIATAIESARAFTAQREEAWTLNALLQVAENLARVSSLEELLPAIVRLPPLLLGCDRCYCLALNTEQHVFVPLAAYGLNTAQRASFVGRPFSATDAPAFVAACAKQQPVQLRASSSEPDAVPAVLRALGGGTLLALPLTARGTTLGLLVADYQNPEHHFVQRVLALYSGIANQVATALESAQLAADAADAAHLEEELRVARDIQTTLLPRHVASPPGWSIAVDWRSARLVGGDFYDFWTFPSRRTDRETRRQADDYLAPVPLAASQVDAHAPALGFVIADVSDKGVPAALFMTLSRSLVRAAALDGSSPGVALRRANRWISRDSDSGMFVTLFYGVLDIERSVLRYTCAGHNPPLLVRAADASVVELKTPGIALGVIEEAFLGEAEQEFFPGDVLVCYTDGVTEAINGVEEDFGVPRLIEVIRSHRAGTAAEILNAITVALANFTGDRSPFDDVTLVVLKRDAVTS